MALLKQSTAYTRAFKMISSTDHFSLKTAASPVVNLSKAGAAFGVAGGAVTEIANGWYKVALSTTDTNTLGDLAYYITGSGADDTDFCDQVSALIEADLATPTNITAGTITTVTTVTTLTNLPTIPANWLTAAGTAADFGTEVAAAVWQDAVAGDFTVASSIGKAIYIANIIPGAAGGHFIAGTNAATTITTGLTTTFTGNLTGSVASVTGLTASNLDTTISSRLAPTVAARTLDVSVGGEAGLDWANVGTQSTAVNLSATTVNLANTVTTVTGLTASNLDTTVSSRATPGQILTTALTEAYAANGVAPTLSQLLFLVQQSLHEFSIAATTRTVKKLDRATTAATFTLDDANNPTSTTRAT